VALGRLLFDGPPLDSYAIRGPAWVTLAILRFCRHDPRLQPGFVSIRLGSGAVDLCCLLDLDLRLEAKCDGLKALIAAVVMTAFCVVLFVYLLQLPFQLWPWY
jgi:hypothetical protein